VHCSVASDPNAPLTRDEFRSLIERLNPLQMAQLQSRMARFVSDAAANAKKAAQPKLTTVESDPPGAA
jgi:hypothetical protein